MFWLPQVLRIQQQTGRARAARSQALEVPQQGTGQLRVATALELRVGLHATHGSFVMCSNFMHCSICSTTTVARATPGNRRHDTGHVVRHGTTAPGTNADHVGRQCSAIPGTSVNRDWGASEWVRWTPSVVGAVITVGPRGDAGGSGP